MVKLSNRLLALIYLAACKFLVIFRHDGLCNLLDARRCENILQGLLNNVPFDKILLFVLFAAGMALFTVCAGVIIINAPVIASPTFANHMCAAVPTESLSLQQIFDFGLIGGRRVCIRLDDDLHLVEQFFIYHLFREAGNNFAVILILADIGCVRQCARKGVVRQRATTRTANAAPRQLVDNLLHRYARGVLFKQVADNGCALFIDEQFSV